MTKKAFLNEFREPIVQRFSPPSENGGSLEFDQEGGKRLEQDNSYAIYFALYSRFERVCAVFV